MFYKEKHRIDKFPKNYVANTINKNWESALVIHREPSRASRFAFPELSESNQDVHMRSVPPREKELKREARIIAKKNIRFSYSKRERQPNKTPAVRTSGKKAFASLYKSASRQNVKKTVTDEDLNKDLVNRTQPLTPIKSEQQRQAWLHCDHSLSGNKTERPSEAI